MKTIILADFALETIRIRNQRANAKKLMAALREFSKEASANVIRFRTGNGDSLQVLWDMAKTELGMTDEKFEAAPVVIVRKIREGKTVFTENLPLNFANVDRAALVKTLQDNGLVVTNPEGSENNAVIVKIGASHSEITTLPEYDAYIKNTAEYRKQNTVNAI